MAIWAALRGWLGRGGALMDNTGTQYPVPSGALVAETALVGVDGALQVSAVWAAVEKTSKAVATLPLFVYRTDGQGQRTLARGDLLWQVLHESPNERMTPAEFWTAMLLNLLMRGNAYARLTRNARGEVVAMVPMAADQVEVTLLPDGAVVYEYAIGADVAVLAAESVLHLKEIGNGTIGLARLEYMRATLSEAANAQAHANRTFANSGKLAGILMVDRVLNQQQRDAIRQKFTDLASGPMARLYVLEASMKYEQVGLSPADVQLLETRKFSISEIARWFNIPQALLEAVDMTNHASLVDFWLKTSVRPLLVSIEQAIRKRVLTNAQRAVYTVEWSFEGLLRASAAERYDLYSKGVQNGIISRREARQLENLPPRPDMNDDMLTAQVNLVPLSRLGESAASGAPAAEPVAQ